MAGVPSEVSTCPVTRTSRVAINPKLTLVFSCDDRECDARRFRDVGGAGEVGRGIARMLRPIGSVTSGPPLRSVALT